MTSEMRQCAAEIRYCWKQCDESLQQGDTEGANNAFGRVFEVVDTFPALLDEDVWALRFLCALTWVKVAAALEVTGQDESAEEARRQAFGVIDEVRDEQSGKVPPGWSSLEFARGLESEESADLVGRLYLLCSKAGRRDTLLWGRCFMEFDRKVHGENSPPSVN